MPSNDTKGPIIAAIISGIFVVAAAIISGIFLLQSSTIKEQSASTATAIAMITLPALPTLTLPSTYTPLPTYTPNPTQTPYPTLVLATVKLATPVPTPTPTSTPVGMVSQIMVIPDQATKGGWVQTTIFLKQGDKVSIRYLSGAWYIGQDIQGSWTAQPPTDANGYTGRDSEKATALVGGSPDKCKVLATAPYGSLIGRVGNPGPSFLVGNSLDLKSPASGLLYLGINYINHNIKTGCPYGDGGELTISVTVSP